MANGRRLHALREFRQYLDNEIYQINKQLEAEGANGASGAWLSEQRHTKQALYDELDYVIETYGNADTTNNRLLSVMPYSFSLSLLLSWHRS